MADTGKQIVREMADERDRARRQDAYEKECGDVNAWLRTGAKGQAASDTTGQPVRDDSGRFTGGGLDQGARGGGAMRPPDDVKSQMNRAMRAQMGIGVEDE